MTESNPTAESVGDEQPQKITTDQEKHDKPKVAYQDTNCEMTDDDNIDEARTINESKQDFGRYYTDGLVAFA